MVQWCYIFPRAFRLFSCFRASPMMRHYRQRLCFPSRVPLSPAMIYEEFSRWWAEGDILGTVGTRGLEGFVTVTARATSMFLYLFWTRVVASSFRDQRPILEKLEQYEGNFHVRL